MTIKNDNKTSPQTRCLAEITLRAGVGYLSGALTVETVPRLYQQNGGFVEKHDIFDL
ncbi:hypothetical protein [Rickettsiella massiliensis]|uniref:hypothetical protein n=1 Tax=Rickettsiella massiliensis TaxID=676517 RepID=UPI00030664DE|nr:hypothetical protein [Rickettsiella massiliensis]